MSQLNQKFIYDNDISVSEYFYNTRGDYETFSASIKKYFKSFDKIEVEYNLKNLSGAIVNSYCSKIFTTNDGMILGINFTQSGLQGQDGPIVCIDINGFRYPNKMGVDYFLFVFTQEGNIVPYGTKDYSSSGQHLPYWYGSEYCNYKSSNSSGEFGSSASCAYYALSDTHPLKAGRTYWKDFLSESKN